MSSKRTDPLTRETIFRAALAIVDAEGADALSMRRLAQSLGVEAMSLYHHVSNKQALLDGVVELSLRPEAPVPPPAGASWEDTVVAAVSGFRHALVAHPNVLPLVIAHPPTAPAAVDAYIGVPLRFLVAHGMSASDAGELFASVFALSFGHALLTTNYPAIRLAGVPPVEFDEQAFERAVRVLVEGFAGACRA